MGWWARTLEAGAAHLDGDLARAERHRQVAARLGQEARAPGLPMSPARAIVSDRVARGPFLRPEDLVLRGLITVRTVRRLAPRLICVPPGPAPEAWPPR